MADETIFADIERMSEYRIHVPEDLELSKISFDSNFARPGLNLNMGQGGGHKNQRKNGRKRK